MASAEFIERVLSTDVDENVLNSIVGARENQFVTFIPSVSSQNNLVNAISSQLNATSSATSYIGQNYNKDQCVSAIDSINFQVPNTSKATFIQPSFISQPNISLSVPYNSDSLNTQTHALNSTTYVNFPSQSFVSGCVDLTSPHSQYIHSVQGGTASQQSANNTNSMQPPLVIKQGTNSGQLGMQPGMVTVPMTVNSSMSGSMPNVMTINKPGGQNVVVTTQNLGSGQPAIIPNVQILNMRPGTPGAVAAQKSVATVSPRVVIGTPQVVGTRAATPGITLQTLQSLQQGQQGHLLLKTESGQYQLLRVGPAPAANTMTAPQPQTLRLSTVPAHAGVATVSTSVTPQGQLSGQMSGQMSAQMSSQMSSQMSAQMSGQMSGQMPGQMPGQMSSQMSSHMSSQMSGLMPGQMPPAPVATPVVPASVASVQSPLPQPLQPTVITQKPLDNTKEKCRNFLANLLDLSSKEPKSVETSVRNLIQELIDAQVEPEEFCDRLEKLLNASPQPCLIGFLKKSLPLLRQSLVTNELIIEGIIAPSPHVAFSAMSSSTQQVLGSSNLQLPYDDEDSSPTLTTLLPPVMPVNLPPSPQRPVNVVQVQPNVVQPKLPSKSGSSIAVLQNIPVHTKLNVTKVGKTMSANSKAGFSRPSSSSAGLATVLTAGKSLLREKEKKSINYSQPYVDDKMAGDDDINDVAAMGGVNLAEESQRILGSTELIGTQIRSCKDEYLVPMSIMQARLKAAAAKHGLDEPSPDVAGLISHAVHERLKNLVEKLAVVAQHRIDLIKTDPRYDVTQDVKGQIKFLEELDRVDKKRREDSEREMLLRAAKSRSKNEDPEQAKLKAKAKEMQRAELEELRQREANLTALQAIGPRKKPRLDGPSGAGDSVISGGHSSGGFSGRSQLALRTRLKRINHRDMIFLLEQERDTSHSTMLYRSYLK